jgi:uncharacterized damage-inducible protein DinB
LTEDTKLLNWKPPDGGRSVSEILEHVSWTVSVVCSKIAEDYEIELKEAEETFNDNAYERLVFYINSAYSLFRQLCNSLQDEWIDETITLPPPARMREGTIEKILRVMTGFHTVHHAGQVALTLRRASDTIGN